MRRWFEASFEGPTPAQAGGWEAISSGEHALICAPTGSGKTLASFLWGIDKLARSPELGIGAEIAVGLRTGDTPQKERRAMAKTPPDILITTPESLYLMLSSSVREILTGVEAVIVDEIHAVAQTKRGPRRCLQLLRRLRPLRPRLQAKAGLVQLRAVRRRHALASAGVRSCGCQILLGDKYHPFPR